MSCDHFSINLKSWQPEKETHFDTPKRRRVSCRIMAATFMHTCCLAVEFTTRSRCLVVDFWLRPSAPGMGETKKLLQADLTSFFNIDLRKSPFFFYFWISAPASLKTVFLVSPVLQSGNGVRGCSLQIQVVVVCGPLEAPERRLSTLCWIASRC